MKKLLLLAIIALIYACERPCDFVEKDVYINGRYSHTEFYEQCYY